ncbi:SUMO-interacting motif-containing protein 1 isoform X2 [Falco biarmicus]|uniref:SUMO-interacting motif-containing protein 1 isoform X2 n=1 Tax=Falco rusticolus TaxID=120794 RepID=UPI00188677B8|nr:SUMO-interacting motif-containing protein 1 isoform X2 [Falco rusticolus]XP_055574368.1 SUMO-interacting motif-containing protein 1 isoform X2 [Falco cherrug]XP_056205082.1 SUMO-interacting motif-containing protein 1 isoform X2 [Falco biarmicus]
MADSVIVISDSDSESSRPPPLPVTGSDPSQARPGPGKRRASPASGAGTAASPTCSCCPSDGRSLELQEIIDLTCEDVSTEQVPWSTLTIIDLTEDTCSPPHTTGGADQDHKQVPAALAAHMSHPQLCSTTTQETEATAGPSPAAPWHSSPAEPSAITDTAESTERWSCLSITSSHHGSSCSLEKDCSTTTFNSDLGSLASMQLDSDLLSLSPSSLDSSSSWKAGGPEEETPHLCQQRELPSRLSPAPAIPTTPGKAQGPFLGAGDLSPHKAIEQVMPDRTKADSKAWLNKLQCFRRSGVQHLFLQGIASDRETQQWKPELIPSGKLSMVHTTMEENFLEGTLHFLSDFVSRQHCPPKEIVSHLIRQILLDPQEEEILKDTYMLLMKIQMLHPANTATVGWDWTLLQYIMEDQEKPPGWLLFLQYVVQTLEDDFQENLRLRLLQKSIAKKVLSCDTCFNNINSCFCPREVVKWLVAAVTGAGFFQAQEQPQETTSSSAEAKTEHSSSAPWLASTDQAEVAPPTFFAQKVMLLLQRMLSIAVEVDKSPNCSSCKIADVIFPFILHIPLRSQREAFFNTMESQLLRCRLLELVFQHSCDVPTTLPLSLAKILYFLNHFSVLLKYEDDTATWQRWDEMLQYLSLLLQSYQNVVLAFPLAEHLRSSLNERMDLIIQKAKPKLQDGDDISHLDIQLKIEDSISRMQQVLGQPFPLQITEKLCMLRELFLIVTAT